MKKKFGFFVPEAKQEATMKALDQAGISYTSMNGIFHFDLVSFIIGFVIALVFGIVVF